MQIFILFLTLITPSLCDLRPQVDTPMGTVRGSNYNSVEGRKYYAFEGIPYAKPPLGKYRFREPRPIRTWDGIVEARFLYTCLQYNHYAHEVIGEEDCLYLNVYTPNSNITAQLDVIVFIHGGAYMFGSGHTYKQDILMGRDVVYVSFNYRLGPFGFLSTEDATVPGNNGMKDQVLALKWIKNNIKFFGGNPNSITLSGMSAGGSSVHLHYMSPLSVNLFTRGFSLSGTALNPWVLQENALEKARKLASIVECDTRNDTRDMIKCLSHIPALQVAEAVKQLFGYLYNPFSPFGVVIEPQVSHNPFLSAHPFELLKTNQIQDLPWITSVTESEGLYPAAEFWSDQKYLDDLQTNWTELAPHILDFYYTSNHNEHASLATKIKQEYLQDKPINKNNFMDLVKMCSDRLFIADSQTSAKMHANIATSPVYYYYFSYRGAHSKSESLSGTNENFGASHGDDTVYVLSSNVNVTSTDSDKKMTEVLLDLWTNYAKTGVPTLMNSTWKVVSKNVKDSLNYIEIKSPFETINHSKDFEGTVFWNNLKLKENHNLFPEIKDEL